MRVEDLRKVSMEGSIVKIVGSTVTVQLTEVQTKYLIVGFVTLKQEYSLDDKEKE